jgi:hypothetical protein
MCIMDDMHRSTSGLIDRFIWSDLLASQAGLRRKHGWTRDYCTTSQAYVSCRHLTIERRTYAACFILLSLSSFEYWSFIAHYVL